MPNAHVLVSRQRLQDLADKVGKGEAALLLPNELHALLRHVSFLEDRIIETEGDFCVVCGCTHTSPCDPPCGWADFNLCSSCDSQPGVTEEDRYEGPWELPSMPCPDCAARGEEDPGEGEPWCARCRGLRVVPPEAPASVPVLPEMFPTAAEDDLSPRLIEVFPGERAGRARFWLPKAAGYTDRVEDAGLYTAAEAARRTAGSDRSHAVSADEVLRHHVAVVVALARRISAARAGASS